jgi:putative IMPACT (imprinted ancient) family translation regulator
MRIEIAVRLFFKSEDGVNITPKVTGVFDSEKIEADTLIKAFIKGAKEAIKGIEKPLECAVREMTAVEVKEFLEDEDDEQEETD